MLKKVLFAIALTFGSMTFAAENRGIYSGSVIEYGITKSVSFVSADAAIVKFDDDEMPMKLNSAKEFKVIASKMDAFATSKGYKNFAISNMKFTIGNNVIVVLFDSVYW